MPVLPKSAVPSMDFVSGSQRGISKSLVDEIEVSTLFSSDKKSETLVSCASKVR